MKSSRCKQRDTDKGPMGDTAIAVAKRLYVHIKDNAGRQSGQGYLLDKERKRGNIYGYRNSCRSFPAGTPGRGVYTSPRFMKEELFGLVPCASVDLAT